MNKFLRAELTNAEEVLAFMREQGFGEARLKHLFSEVMNSEYWINDIYQVAVRKAEHAIPFINSDAVKVLSVKRIDQEPIFDWRHMQEMKNELFGSEREMVQLFPSEERLVDTANQYWFYVLDQDQAGFPFGFSTRLVSPLVDGLHIQRPFENSSACAEEVSEFYSEGWFDGFDYALGIDDSTGNQCSTYEEWLQVNFPLPDQSKPWEELTDKEKLHKHMHQVRKR